MIKQVIVMRKDLKMRRGKEIAQGGHAAMAWLTERIVQASTQNRLDYSDGRVTMIVPISFSMFEWEWITGLFTKICCKADSEQQLLDIAAECKAAGIQCVSIVDAGKTEFNGVPTPTCLGIGPDEAEKIDKITRKLELY